MAGKRGRGRGRGGGGGGGRRTVVVLDDTDSSDSDAPPTKSQIVRLGLRRRWELASVLNFIHVFKEVIGGDLVSAEEIETGLINPNVDLALIHTSLLKGIPPVSRNLTDADVWVTELCKQLAAWWPWVAEGENPLEDYHGDKMARYRGFDPMTRLLILKALCEVRALQDDILRYINDRLKNGTPITAFRKERIGDDDAGVTYWYDGDPVLGFRLYREIARDERKQQNEEKAYMTQPTVESSWETLATNLKEFRNISGNLLSSKSIAEAAIVEIVKTDVVPVLEKLKKKKRQALKGRSKGQAVKRKRRQTFVLDSSWNTSGVESRHSRRQRKAVNYTFDEYDRSIEEATQTPKKRQTESVKHNRKIERRVKNKDNLVDDNMESDKDQGSLQQAPHQVSISDDDDDEKEDFDGSNADDARKSESLDESDDADGLVLGQASRSQKDVKAEVVGLHRSRRTTGSKNGNHFGAQGMKNRLRNRVTGNTDNTVLIISDDSEDESMNKQSKAVVDTESGSSTSATVSDEHVDSCSDHRDDDY